MTGTKFGCGISACGACTVHLGGVATRSCIVPISHVGDRPIVTIEGIGQDAVGRAVQDAWVDQRRRAMWLLPKRTDHGRSCAAQNTPRPTEQNIEESMGGNLCRCGTYPRIRAAIKSAAAQINERRCVMVRLLLILEVNGAASCVFLLQRQVVCSCRLYLDPSVVGAGSAVASAARKGLSAGCVRQHQTRWQDRDPG